MKVCQLCAVDFTLKKFLLPLIDGMTAEGWRVTAVCSDGPYVADLIRDGYRIQTVPIARSLNPFSAIRSLYGLVQLFRRERFDVLHVHTPVAALLGRIAARIVGIPLVVYTAHGFYFHDQMPSWKRKLFITLERIGGWFTDFLFCQSAEDAEDAVVEGIMARHNVLAIGNGVDVVRFDPLSVGNGAALRREFGIPEHAYVVGLIGRQVREKGVAEFLLAAEALSVKYPQLWILLVGERLDSDHAHGVEIEFERAQRALGTRLVATGLRNDVPELLATMDLFCLPSWREGMPRTIIEAMMMGKPVLATNIRGAREEVVAEQTGVLVPTRAPQQLADAIEQFIADPARGRTLGEAGRERALRLYDESKVVAMQLTCISKAAQARGIC